jgi:hypothetical protein
MPPSSGLNIPIPEDEIDLREKGCGYGLEDLKIDGHT